MSSTSSSKVRRLTEGLMMAEEARRLGLEVMVWHHDRHESRDGAAFILAQQCSIVDLDWSDFPRQGSVAVGGLPRRRSLLRGDDVGVRRAPSPHDEREDVVRPPRAA
jgi:hypothetical protein